MPNNKTFIYYFAITETVWATKFELLTLVNLKILLRKIFTFY